MPPSDHHRYEPILFLNLDTPSCCSIAGLFTFSIDDLVYSSLSAAESSRRPKTDGENAFGLLSRSGLPHHSLTRHDISSYIFVLCSRAVKMPSSTSHDAVFIYSGEARKLTNHFFVQIQSGSKMPKLSRAAPHEGCLNSVRRGHQTAYLPCPCTRCREKSRSILLSGFDLSEANREEVQNLLRLRFSEFGEVEHLFVSSGAAVKLPSGRRGWQYHQGDLRYVSIRLIYYFISLCLALVITIK